MRVYSVTKQGTDQDKHGTFIKKYVPELGQVPLKFIHEPWKMPRKTQESCGVIIGTTYPKPIVDEKASAKLAKDRVSGIKKQGATQVQAQQVYAKHGSRSNMGGRRSTGSAAGASGSAASGATKKRKLAAASSTQGQPSILAMLKTSAVTTDVSHSSAGKQRVDVGASVAADDADAPPPAKIVRTSVATPSDDVSAGPAVTAALVARVGGGAKAGPIDANVDDGQPWQCRVCTFINAKPHAPVCEMCTTAKFLS